MARIYKNWLESFREVNSGTETPDKFVLWSGLSALAGALGRRVYYEGGTFRLYPNQYIWLIGPPGIKKSTAINLGFDILREVKEINIGPSSVTWQYLVDKLIALNYGDAKNLLDGGSLLRDNAPLCIPAPELGTFIDFEDRAFLDLMCVLWDSPNTHEKGNRTTGDQILHGPCLNLIGGVTPAWVKLHMRPEMLTTGLLSRTIFVYCDKPERLVTWPDSLIKEDRSENLQYLARDLAIIAGLKGPIVIEEKVRKHGEILYHRIAEESPTAGEYLSNWLSRQWAHTLCTAIALSVAKGNSLVIKEADWLEAEGYIQESRKDLDKVLNVFSIRKELAPQSDIEAFIKKHKQPSVAGLRSHFSSKLLSRELEEALKNLINNGGYSYLNEDDGVLRIHKVN